MKLHIVAVGNRMPGWVDSGFEEYARRMPREASIRLIEVKPEPRGDSSTPHSAKRLIDAEAKRISAALPKDAYRVMLDERGRACSTRELAARLSGWRMDGRDVAFVIGGADGLSPGIKNAADWLWSLSSLTLPHGLARVIVAEQLYRALSILGNHPYHRA